jgi:hypothetical protein
MTETYYLIEHRLSDGRWVGISAPIYSADDARVRIAHTREQYTTQAFRLVLITTTTEVVEP